jgi:hypothetical protein
MMKGRIEVSMKKRIISLFLVAVMCITMVPDITLAAQSTSESEPVYLGTEAEYQSTLEAMFDENGLRAVSVGYNSNKGTLHEKVGLVDKYGNFVVQPIYDKIVAEAEYLSGNSVYTTKPEYFIGGYAQAVRDGKMGLINTKGEEVVPCKYDYVGLPSEGICRVYRFKERIAPDDIYYLGYWSLEKKQEIVAPNKYLTIFTNMPIIDNATGKTRKNSDGSYLCVHDFIDGYALVFTEPGVTKTVLTDYRKSTVIDKNGKDIFGKTYISIVNSLVANYCDTYPQKGPYLSFVMLDVSPAKYKNTEIYKAWQKQADIKRGDVKFGASDLTGLAGAEGILIPAVYASNHFLSDADFDGDGKYEGAYLSFGSANFRIIPDKKLVITSNALNPKIDRYAPPIANRYGVIDLNGKTVIPFGPEVDYNHEYQVFASGGKIYNTKGKVISKRTYSSVTHLFTNGYQLVWTNTGKYNQKYSSDIITWYAVKYDGTETNLTKALGLGKYETDFEGVSQFNTKGYLWLQRKGGKWGLIDFKGKTILPFVYDKVNHDQWDKGKNGYAIVTKNGKQGIVNNAGKELVACIYKGFTDYTAYADYGYRDRSATVLAMEGKDGYGLINITTGKVIVLAKYNSVHAFTAYGQQNLSYFDAGAYYAELGDKKLLLDQNGKEVFSTTKRFYEAIDGLYYYTDGTGYFDNRGRIIFPGELQRNYNLEYIYSYTIYVKDKKVYRISANYLDINYRVKAISSEDSKELEAFAQSQREAHRKAYEQAKSDPYQQKPIYKEAFVSFRNVPDKLTYKVGEAFETKGFKAVWVDVYGNETDISSEITFDVNGTKIYNGYKFTMAGNKTVNCSYKGKNLNNFKVSVISSDAKYLADGDYYITVLGKYFTVVSGNYLELSDKKPDKPFTVKQLYVDKDGYFIYKIMYDGGYVYQPSSKDGDQLRVSLSSASAHQWRIAQYSNFCTIRDAGKQKLIVNASGQSSKNGTKVIVWSHSGSAPDHAKLSFIKAN